MRRLWGPGRPAGFPTVTGLVRGYDRRQVDAFLDLVEARRDAGAGGDPVSTTDIRRVGFDLVRGGYRVADVDARLDELEERALGPGWDRPAAGGARPRTDAAALLRPVLAAPRGARLTRCGRLHLGYRPADVDAYLEHLARALDGAAPAVTAAEVRRTTFRPRRGGYAEAGVDDLLDQVVEDLLRRRVG